MTSPDLYRYVGIAWEIALLVWFLGALNTKKTVQSQSRGWRLLQLAVGGAAIVLLSRKGRWLGLLSARFLPQSNAIAWAGLGITVAGIAFAIVARLYLGRNWSGDVTIKQDHTLVRGGPYAIVRNPIYTGLQTAIIGNAIVLGEFRGLVAAALVLMVILLKIRLEEAFMKQEFGAEFVRYEQKVKRLIPFVW